MARKLRVLILVATAAMAFLAAANIGSAKISSPSARQTPAPCTQTNPTFPCTMMTSTGQRVFNSQAELEAFFQGGGSGQPQQPPQQQQPGQQQGGQQGGQPQGGMTGGRPQGGQQGGQQGGMPQGGQMGGGMPNIDWANLKPCAAGTMPTPEAPCKFDQGQMAECGPEGPPKLVNGKLPPGAVPCRPAGMEEGAGFDAVPTGNISKELKNKFMVININVQGSGEENGSFDVTFKSVEEGVKKETKTFLNEQLEGESFVIQADAKTKCFADTEDADKIPDPVSCKELDDAADNAPGSIKAQFRGKVTFDESTYQPKFKADKIVFLKGKFNVAKIG